MANSFLACFAMGLQSSAWIHKFCFAANSLVRVSAEKEAALNKRDGIVPWDDAKTAWVNARFKYALEHGTDFCQFEAGEEYDRLHAQGKV